MTGTIDDPLDFDLMRLLVADNDIITVQVEALPGSGPNFLPIWRLLSADGAVTPSCGAWTAGAITECGPLPIAGNPYRIQVRDWGLADTGIYRVTASDCLSNAGVEAEEFLPAEFGLRCVSPNPARAGSESMVEFEVAIPQAANVALEAFDSAGRLVGTLLRGSLDPGIHRVQVGDMRLSSGVYYFSLRSVRSMATTRMVVVR